MQIISFQICDGLTFVWQNIDMVNRLLHLTLVKVINIALKQKFFSAFKNIFSTTVNQNVTFCYDFFCSKTANKEFTAYKNAKTDKFA